MPSQKFPKDNFYIESLLDGSSSHQFIRSKYCRKVIQLFILQDQNCFSRKYIQIGLMPEALRWLSFRQNKCNIVFVSVRII